MALAIAARQEFALKRDVYGTSDETNFIMAKRGGSELKPLCRQDISWSGIDYGEPGN